MTESPSKTNQLIILTPPGAGAIAVVRLSGPGVGSFLGRFFSRAAKAGRCVHGELRDGTRVIDDPVVVLSDDGSGADINLHGGAWIVGSFVELAVREGFVEVGKQVPSRQGTEGGEEGVLADLALEEIGSAFEREVMEYLPVARTELAIRSLLAQPAAWGMVGCEGVKVRGCESTEVRTSMPAAFDIAAILADRSLWRLLHPPMAVIIGVPNAGKSTLANQLFGQERSIVADLPGTTRDWVGEMANIDGLAVMLVDTPGLRQTIDPLEGAAIANSRGKIDSSDLVVLVLDPTQPVEAQRELCRQWPDGLKVINKIDRSPAWDLDLIPAIRVCALRGQGLADLRFAIRSHFGLADLSPGRPRWWTERQRDILTRAMVDPKCLDELCMGIG